ncbi:MAG: hypothetical protein ACK2UK_02305 [Candidatus Promineifilaceae bacterium]
MSNKEVSKQEGKDNGTERAPYEAPAIVYEGLITTRAATGAGGGGADASNPANDASDIFGSDN